jgi:protein involved in polysaccharide export with SLBB domain
MNNIKIINSYCKSVIFFATLFIILIYAGYSQSQSQQSPSKDSSSFNSTIYNELPPRDFSDKEQKLRNLIVDQEYKTISKIEKYYNKKNKDYLKLQGYEYFKNNFQFYDYQRPLTTGSLQDEYVMGIGDVLNFVLQGGRNETFKKTVNKDGLLYLDFTTPISALGRTFGDIKKEVYARGKNSLTETEIYISVDRIRNINVEVTGEVNLPGSYNVSSLSSVLDVLLIAGGIKKSGTLRRVKVINGKNIEYIDLYQFLFGLEGDVQVQNVLNKKSIIVVSPIGKTVAASGSFLRGGIYEILENSDNVKNLTNYAGGFSEPGNFFITRQSVLAKNLKNNVGIAQKNDKLRDGDVFFSHSQDNYLNPSIELIGSVKSPGMYPHKEFDDLLKLLPNNIALNADTYKLSILIERINRKTLRKEFINKEIKKIIFKEDNFLLEENDKIYVFTHKDLEFLSSSIMMQVFFTTYEDENLFSQNCETLEKFSKLVRERTEASSIKYFFLKITSTT